MHKTQLRAIGETLPSLVTPDMTAKDLMEAAKKAFPLASNKDLVRAAFYSVILYSESDPRRAAQLQDIAIKSRIS
jgi:hypothetical protein